MENVNPKRQTTLLDLNMYVLDQIFKALEDIDDKINLAKAHPRLTEAFAYHGQLQFREIDLKNVTEKQFSYILRNCGEHVQYVKVFDLVGRQVLQLIRDNCPNVNKIKINGLNNIYCDANKQSIFTRLSFRTLVLSALIISDYNFFQLISKCKALRKIEVQSSHIDIISISILLEILVKNGVTPEDPFTFVVNKSNTNLDDNLLAEISQCGKSKLIHFQSQEPDYFDGDEYSFYDDDSYGYIDSDSDSNSDDIG